VRHLLIWRVHLVDSTAIEKVRPCVSACNR